MAMNRQTHRKTLEVGIRTVIFLYFKQQGEQWRDAFNMDDTDRASVQDVEYTDFGPMEEGTEMGGYTYDDGTEGPTTTYVMQKYQKAFKYSEEVLEDDQNGLMRRYPRAMARSILHTLDRLEAEGRITRAKRRDGHPRSDRVYVLPQSAKQEAA